MIKLNEPTGIERRRHHRAALAKLAKVRRSNSLAYAPATTVNLSASGALIRTRPGAAPQVGDRVEIVVAWDDEPVVPRAASLSAKVRRVDLADQDAAYVALEFAGACLSRELAADHRPEAQVALAA